MIGRGIGKHGADLRAGLEQPGGLAVDDIEVARLAGIRIAGVHELQHFALGNGVGGVRHDVHDAHAVEASPSSERRGSTGNRPTRTLVALPNSSLAVLRPRRSEEPSTTSSCSRVAVWMNSMMAAASMCRIAAVAAGACGQKHQKGAQALAAGIDDVVGDPIDQGDVAVQTMLDDPVDGLKIGGY